MPLAAQLDPNAGPPTELELAMLRASQNVPLQAATPGSQAAMQVHGPDLTNAIGASLGISPKFRPIGGNSLNIGQPRLENPLGFQTDALGRVIENKTPAQQNMEQVFGQGFDASKLSLDPTVRAQTIQDIASQVAAARQKLQQENPLQSLANIAGAPQAQGNAGVFQALLAKARTGDQQAMDAIRAYGRQLDARGQQDLEFQNFQNSALAKAEPDRTQFRRVEVPGGGTVGVNETTNAKNWDRVWDPNAQTYISQPHVYQSIVEPQVQKNRGLFENALSWGSNILPQVGLGLLTGGTGVLGGLLAGAGALRGALASAHDQQLFLTPAQMVLGGLGGYANAAAGAAGQAAGLSQTLGEAGRLTQSMDALRKAQQLGTLASRIRLGSNLGAQFFPAIGGAL